MCRYANNCSLHCCVHSFTKLQTYLEKLQEIDPIVKIADDYLMAGRAAMLLRGLGYALKYRINVAQIWSPYVHQLLTEEVICTHTRE